MIETDYLIVQLSIKDILRISSYIDFDAETECWNWTGEVNKDGYGRTKYKGRRECVHRLLYSRFVEPLPRGHGHGIPELDHVICNNKKCCNPEHLELVTHRENVLRSESPTTINARKTHCIRGHLLPSEPNDKQKIKRYCKICLSDYGRERYLRKKRGEL